LEEAGLAVAHFDGVQPNPTTDNITAGAGIAESLKADVIVGLGGGSSMDSAKAIAVEAAHPGTCWDYLFFRETQPTQKTLPVIAVSTTSGTGSQVTQVAVVTHTRERCKSAIYNPVVFPKVCIVDPELMLTLPGHITSVTGFDAFCHAFESMLHPNASPLTETLAEEAIHTIAVNLPASLNDLGDVEFRAQLAYADTLAGLCIANAGVTLPHGVGMAISGMYPHVAHGEALAVIYPPFTRFTYSHAPEKFARVGRILDPELNSLTDEEASKKSCAVIDAFIESIGMTMTLKDADMPEREIPDLAKAGMVLPDYKANPHVAAEDEMLELIKQAYAGVR
jgi:alcohol dehydrogenase class IV